MRPDDPDTYTLYQLEAGPYIENWFFHDQFNDEISGPFCCQDEAMREVYRLVDEAELVELDDPDDFDDEPDDESLDEFDDAEPLDSEVDPPSRVLQLPLF